MFIIKSRSTEDLTYSETWEKAPQFNRVITQNRFTGLSGFTKPDTPKINPLINGYRMPSDYSCPYTSERVQSGGTPDTTKAIYVPYSVSGTVRMDGGDRGILTERNSGSAFSPVPWPIWSPSYDHLRTKILVNIKDEILDVSMVVAEMQSTVTTIGSLLNRVGRSLNAINKKNPRSFYYLLTGKTRDGRRPTQRFLKETSSEYLQWKYGIMPTLMDLEGAVRGMDINEKSSLFDNPPLLVARAIIDDSRTSSVKVQPSTALGAYTDVSASLIAKRTIKARCDYEITGEALRGLNRYGIGLGSIATVAWDKTPFTFVLDMAIPIASLLKAWSALDGVNVKSYCETTFEEYTIKGFTTYIPNGNVTVVSPGSSPCRQFSRRAFSSPPMPLPFIRNPITTGNLSTVLALFTQLRRKA